MLSPLFKKAFAIPPGVGGDPQGGLHTKNPYDVSGMGVWPFAGSSKISITMSIISKYLDIRRCVGGLQFDVV